MKRIPDIIIEPKTTHNIKGNINDNIIPILITKKQT